VTTYLWFMKRLALVFCLLLNSGHASESVGIQFFNGSWNAALAEARRQHKPLFVDFHTHWCPPCHKMAREAFPNPTVGEKFNTTFINYQVDAEVGEGPELARRFGVRSYPTALYLTADGGLVHRAVGYAGVNAMLTQVDQVLRMPAMRKFIRKQRRQAVDMSDGSN